VRGLDDPENPYREQYGAWDRWLIDHATYPSFDEMKAWQNGTAPEGWVYLRPTVTPEGFLVPQLAELRSLLAQQSDFAAYKGRPSCVPSFSAAGQMDPAMAAGLESAKLALWAASLPEIPDWLAASPPKRAVVLPDGEAATYGPLGSGAGPVDAALWRFGVDGAPEVYYRYSATGEELGHTVPGQPWPELFMPGYTEQILFGASRENAIPVTLNGYTLWIEPLTQEVRAVHDYTGEQLPADTDTGARRGGMVVELEGEMVVRIHGAQVGLAG
jgi:hypothetical protein